MKALQPHLLLGLVACLLLLFSHSWVMFYLIGTGKAIKDAVNENQLETELSRAHQGVQEPHLSRG